MKAAIAKKCLEAIDRLRDVHGIAANDARHPDVMSRASVAARSIGLVRGNPDYSDRAFISAKKLDIPKISAGSMPGQRILPPINWPRGHPVGQEKGADSRRAGLAASLSAPFRAVHWLSAAATSAAVIGQLHDIGDFRSRPSPLRTDFPRSDFVARMNRQTRRNPHATRPRFSSDDMVRSENGRR